MSASPYSAKSAFASCPSATGESGLTPCRGFPDGAHRCGLAREHGRDMTIPTVVGRMTHRCTCGYEWACIGQFGNLVERLLGMTGTDRT